MNDIKFRECVARVSLKHSGWDIERIDEGYRELVPVTPGVVKRVKIREKESGALIAKPAALNGQGSALQLKPDGSLDEDPVLLLFQMYREDDLEQIPGITLA